MSELLHFSEHRLQEVALGFMAVVYCTRLLWLLHFKAGGDRQPKTGLPGTSVRRGILYSWANIAMPWAMESTRTRLIIYVQFALFHIGVAAAITLSFIIPYGPGVLDTPFVAPLFQAAIGAAGIMGILRIIRRVSDRYMRAISSPDDYFSLVLLTVWFMFAFFAVPNKPEQGGTVLIVYFMLTAFFLMYVPFSKISHYLYYPFTRYYLGKTFGHRGTYPLKHVPAERR
jgi:nitrate reductase gamma subunit